VGAPDMNVKDLSVSLTLTPELVGNLSREAGALEIAQAYVIDSPEMAAEANKELQDVKRRLKAVDEWRERFLAPVRQLTATANEFFNPARKALQEAEMHLKGALIDWTSKEEERVAAERRKAEEIARRLRAEAEARAAAERARAEQEAAEKRRQAAEAEERRRKAEAEGNAKAAATAAAESARREEEARAKIEAGEARAQQAQMAAAAAPVAEVAAPAKLAGFTPRDNWVAEFTTTEDEAKALIVNAIAVGRADLLGLLIVDAKAAGRLAKALKKNFNVPGMLAVNKPVASSRAA
jgi:membrane protein involved in colicin uptake